MKTTSSAPPSPCGKPWPRSASRPVSSMVCTGLVRRRQPFCGPFASNAWASEKFAPRRTRAAPSRRLAPCRKFSVPSTSSAPQRPQLEHRFAAAAIARSGSRRSRPRMSVTCPTVYRTMSPGKTRCLMWAIDQVDTPPVNLASLDLNLLVALDALLQERSVTRAAARMGLSQPALSASLARLRRHFGDELLTRVGKEYRLAAQLRELSRVALSGVERVFTAQAEFDPTSSAREFSLAGERLHGGRAGRNHRRPARRGGPAHSPATVPEHLVGRGTGPPGAPQHRSARAAARLRLRPLPP